MATSPGPGFKGQERRPLYQTMHRVPKELSGKSDNPSGGRDNRWLVFGVDSRYFNSSVLKITVIEHNTFTSDMISQCLYGECLAILGLSVQTREASWECPGCRNIHKLCALGFASILFPELTCRCLRVWS